MKKYRKVDVSEQQLEDLVRWNPSLIEEGLEYIDHQKSTSGGRLDVLMVDSGKSLVVGELKVIEDDDMLMQGIDYFDYVSTHVESYARLYKRDTIDPTRQVRLILIAPGFTQTLINRCKWLNLPISLFTFICLEFDGQEDLVPIFSEQIIPAILEPPVTTKIEDHLEYITDTNLREKVATLLGEIKNWNSSQIALDPVKSGISMKIRGHVFAYLYPRRQHYLIGTFKNDDNWAEYVIRGDDDLENVKPLMMDAIKRMSK